MPHSGAQRFPCESVKRLTPQYQPRSIAPAPADADAFGAPLGAERGPIHRNVHLSDMCGGALGRLLQNSVPATEASVGLFEQNAVEPRSSPAVLPTTALDAALTAQLAVAWAGESGEAPRLGWWRSDLASEFGGEDLFQRLLPQTWRWAVLQAVREAARRRDAELRSASASANELITLFHLGFAIDERLDERLATLKTTASPIAALPDLAHVVAPTWQRAQFADWLAGQSTADYRPTAGGRRLVGEAPLGLEATIAKLLAGLLPLGEAYSMPHFVRER